jgi:FKBP-type peptidyl-prolyl isomerase-like protein
MRQPSAKTGRGAARRATVAPARRIQAFTALYVPARYAQIDDMHAGIKLLEDQPGSGPIIERQHSYRIRVRMWLNKGTPIRWTEPWGGISHAVLEDDGHTLITDVRLDRVFLINGLFYGVEGMRVGGTRKLKISPHLAYGERGVPDVVPSNAVLIVEIAVIEERPQ